MPLYNLADIVSTGYQTGKQIGQDITAGNVLEAAYKGVDTQDPQAAQQVAQRASQLAGMTGNASLAHSFQKQATEFGKDAAETKLKQVETQIKQFDIGARLASGATDKKGLYDAISTSGVDTNTAMILRANVDKLPDTPEGIAQGKKYLGDLATSESEKNKSILAVMTAQIKQQHEDSLENHWLALERNSAQNQAGKETAQEKQADKREAQYNTQIATLQRGFDTARTKISVDPFMKPKDKAKALEDIDTQEATRTAALEERFHPADKEETPAAKPIAKPAAKIETKAAAKKDTFTNKEGKTYNRPTGWSDTKWQQYQDANK